MVRLPGIGAGRAGRSEFGAGWFRDSARLPQPALHRGAHRVPAEDPAARLHVCRRPDRGVRRRTPLGRPHGGGSRPDETGHPRGRGRAFLPAHRSRLSGGAAGSLLQSGGRRQDSRGVDDHHAGRAGLLPVPGKNPHPQAVRGAARLQNREQPHQRPDPGDLHQPDLPRSAGLRLRHGRASLLRQDALPAERGRDRDARRAAQGAVPVQSGDQSEARQAAPALRSAAHARARSDRRRAVRAGPDSTDQRQARSRHRIRDSRGIRRRDGPSAALRTLSGGRLFARVSRLYDRRHGYRGPEGFIDLKNSQEEDYEEVLQDYPDSDDILAALVLEATPKRVRAYRRGGETVTLSGEGLKFAERMLDSRTPPTRRIRPGAVIRIQKDEADNWQIIQLPEAEGAFISANPQDGAVRSLVGGFDFNRSQYNHATQAWRQPGSGFKPFIYSSALEKGFTPATVINDAPVVVDAALTGGQVWEPKNYDGRYEGPIACAWRSPSRRTW